MADEPFDIAAVLPAIGGIWGREASAAQSVGGGRNSRVYRVSSPSGDCCAAKIYFRHPKDTRDRMAAELAAMEFLLANGVARVPRPLGSDKAHCLAIYEFIEGSRLAAEDVTERDIDQLADFLISIGRLTDRPGSEALPIASEACFCLRALAANIEGRLARLRSAEKTGPTNQALHQFLERDFAPALTAAVRWGQDKLAQAGLPPDAELPREARTLSPSDFGFHNALRRADGALTFLDLEYFGWDDPAKMICDFLLHPAMELGRALKARFLGRIRRELGGAYLLDSRLGVAYPMFALKWCTILLNEFVPEHILRRHFAGQSGCLEARQNQQLDKARRMFQTAQQALKSFPYEDCLKT